MGAGKKMAASMATQKVVEASLVAVDAGASPVRVSKKVASSVATQNAVEVSPVAADTGARPGRSSKKMVAPTASRKVAEASPSVMGADLPVMKICRKGETPVAAKKVVEASPAAVNCWGTAWKRRREADGPSCRREGNPVVVDTGAPPQRANKKMAVSWPPTRRLRHPQ